MGKIARFGRHRRKEKGDSAFERKMEAFRTASHRFSCGTGEAGETALAVMEAVRETAGGKEPEAADTFPARYRDFYAFRPEGCLERTAYAAGRMLLLLPSIFRAEGGDAVEAALDFCELLHRELEPAMNMEMEREGGGSCWFPGAADRPDCLESCLQEALETAAGTVDADERRKCLSRLFFLETYLLEMIYGPLDG